MKNAKGQEVERKFLITIPREEINDFLKGAAERELSIEQAYLFSDKKRTLRVRRIIEGNSTQYIMTMKTGSGLVRGEEEFKIPGRLYKELAAKAEASLKKTRHVLNIAPHKVELDVFHGPLSGLVIAEVEFKSVKEAKTFKPYGWFGPEVTGDLEYGNYALALRYSRRGDHKTAPVMDLEDGLIHALEEIKARKDGGGNIVVLVAGGSASGKTSRVAERLVGFFKDEAVLLSGDDYYKGMAFMKKMASKGRPLNWDHPEALDLEGLQEDIKSLKFGQSINERRYDFGTAISGFTGKIIEPKKVIIVEGLFTLSSLIIVDGAYKIFVDISRPGRFFRRLFRDVTRTGQKPNEILRQFFGTVEPMHNEFVESTKRNADLVILNEFNPRKESGIAGTKEFQVKFRLPEDFQMPSIAPKEVGEKIWEKDEYFFIPGHPEATLRYRILNQTGIRLFSYRGPKNSASETLERNRLEFEVDYEVDDFDMLFGEFGILSRNGSKMTTVTKYRHTFEWDGALIKVDTEVDKTSEGKPIKIGNFLEVCLDGPHEMDKAKKIAELFGADPEPINMSYTEM